MDEIILKSKLYKAQKAEQRLSKLIIENKEMTDKLDKEFESLVGLIEMFYKK